MARKRPNDNPNAGENSRVHQNFAPTDISEMDAFVVFAELETPSLKECERILRDRGHKISHTTLWRWSKDNNWLDKRIKLGKTGGLRLLDMQSAAEGLKALTIEGVKFDIVSAVKGLESRIVRLMADKLLEKDTDPAAKHRSTERPEFYIAMAKLLSDLEDVKRKGFVSDVQTGPREQVVEVKSAPKATPKVEEEPAAPLPALGKVVIRPQFPKPGGKK